MDVLTWLEFKMYMYIKSLHSISFKNHIVQPKCIQFYLPIYNALRKLEWNKMVGAIFTCKLLLMVSASNRKADKFEAYKNHWKINLLFSFSVLSKTY